MWEHPKYFTFATRHLQNRDGWLLQKLINRTATSKLQFVTPTDSNTSTSLFFDETVMNTENSRLCFRIWTVQRLSSSTGKIKFDMSNLSLSIQASNALTKQVFFTRLPFTSHRLRETNPKIPLRSKTIFSLRKIASICVLVTKSNTNMWTHELPNSLIGQWTFAIRTTPYTFLIISHNSDVRKLHQ